MDACIVTKRSFMTEWLETRLRSAVGRSLGRRTMVALRSFNGQGTIGGDSLAVSETPAALFKLIGGFLRRFLGNGENVGHIDQVARVRRVLDQKSIRQDLMI